MNGSPQGTIIAYDTIAWWCTRNIDTINIIVFFEHEGRGAWKPFSLDTNHTSCFVADCSQLYPTLYLTPTLTPTLTPINNPPTHHTTMVRFVGGAETSVNNAEALCTSSAYKKAPTQAHLHVFFCTIRCGWYLTDRYIQGSNHQHPRSRMRRWATLGLFVWAIIYFGPLRAAKIIGYIVPLVSIIPLSSAHKVRKGGGWAALADAPPVGQVFGNSCHHVNRSSVRGFREASYYTIMHVQPFSHSNCN